MSRAQPGAVLITGGHGFTGPHLRDELERTGAVVAAPSRSELDLLDPDAVRSMVRRLRPGAIYHLAALASVGRSWEQPGTVLRSNLDMVLHLLEAARSEAPQARVLIASSSEVYGPPERLPLDERAPLRPQNPYAVSKAACELLAGQYADTYGLQVVRTRAFNHAGPGQADEYLVGTLTRQVAEADLARADEVTLRVGNLDAARDFTDVRDVARAYVVAIDQPPGVYNVCSERAVAVRELVDLLGESASASLRLESDPGRTRPSDVPEVWGSSERLRDLTGWRPEIPLGVTLGDAVEDWRERLGASAAR